MKKQYPATLVVSINAWKDKSGINTLLNLFKGWDKAKLSQIYTRSDLPQTTACDDFFQIAEQAVVSRLQKPWINAGRRLHSLPIGQEEKQTSQQTAELRNKQRLHRHSSWLLTLIRELIWFCGTWKTKELRQYLDDGKWDVVFCPIYPLVYMNRLQSYVLRQTGLKGVAFLGDDNYSYKCGDGSLLFYVHRYFLRRSIRSVIRNCHDVFVMVPKMQREYDEIFGIKSILLTKGIDYDGVDEPKFLPPKSPIQIVYAGKMIYGRNKSLEAVATVLEQINANGVKATLHIYTPDVITPELKKALDIKGSSVLHKPVPYTELQRVLNEADMVLFVESLEPAYRQLARLSFSTKITDYFKSGKCIFAVGGDDIAPIEYLKEKDAAVISTSIADIAPNMERIIQNPALITTYAHKAYECGRKYHNSRDVERIMYDVLSKSMHK